jgi:hypothetical protein
MRRHASRACRRSIARAPEAMDPISFRIGIEETANPSSLMDRPKKKPRPSHQPSP